MTALHSRYLLIIKAGDTFEPLREPRGDFEHWVADGLATELPVLVLDPRRGDALPSPQTLAGVVITGSHAMVSHREAWSERTARWLADAVAHETPVLGICYGHQLLAHALGGVAGDHPLAMEIGTVSVKTTDAARDDELFAELPTRFAAHVVHRQSALTLPSAATLLASNEFEPHQAFRVGNNAWGVQFHPEFDADAMRGYIDTLADSLQNSGVDVQALRAKVTDTPVAATLLRRFADVARQHASARSTAAATS